MMIGSVSQASNRLKSGVHGFTLIELLITVVIIGILAAIVIPAYNSQVRTTRRSDAISALLQSAQDLERCRSDTLSYTVAAGCQNHNNDPATGAPPHLSERGNYVITAVQNATTFTLTATPVAGSPQANDTQCAQFTLDQAGVKAAQDNTATDTTTDCWH
ncbi:type IV pilin protein [Kaarinaea lacus]